MCRDAVGHKTALASTFSRNFHDPRRYHHVTIESEENNVHRPIDALQTHIDMITVTFIRHGESQDNPINIWAGWKDAPLSELGQKQARALGEAFSSIKLDYIYASPLLRAHSTGQAVLEHQPEPKPRFQANPNLREQHFGIAEGKPWLLDIPSGRTAEDFYAMDVYPVLRGRHEKFSGGESMDDLARRAALGIAECVLPHVHEDGVHVVVASHGLCISEMISALIGLDPLSNRGRSYTGLHNTAWTRVTVSLREGHAGPMDASNPPPLEVRVLAINRHEHLATIPLEEQLVEDKKQAEMKAFFGGQTADPISHTNADIIQELN